MKLHTFFTITAVVMVLFGVGVLLAPETVFSLYGVALDANAIMLAHVAGAAVLALGLLAWPFRKSSDPQASRAAATALFGFLIVKITVSFLAQLDSVFNALGWSIIALDGVFVLGYAYFLFLRRTPVAQTGG